MSNTYGYVRVSSKDQNEERQLIAMKDFGVPDNNIYTDKQSGKDFNRPAYKRLMRKLKPDDTLVIKSIDRLGRDYVEILEQWKTISEHKKTAIVVLDMPLLDTRNDRDLIGKLISDIVLQLLSTLHRQNVSLFTNGKLRESQLHRQEALSSVAHLSLVLTP